MSIQAMTQQTAEHFQTKRVLKAWLFGFHSREDCEV